MSGGLEAFDHAAEENKQYLDSQPTKKLVRWCCYPNHISYTDLSNALERRGVDVEKFESRLRAIADLNEELIVSVCQEVKETREKKDKVV